mgnify:CR=1 FL=1|jgi:hypothetical protein
MKYILSFLMFFLCTQSLLSIPFDIHEECLDALFALKRDYDCTDDGIAWRGSVLQGAGRLVRKMVWGDDGLKAALEEAVLRCDSVLAASIFRKTVDLWRCLIHQEEEFQCSLGEMKMRLGFVNNLTGKEFEMEGAIKDLVLQVICWMSTQHICLKRSFVSQIGGRL